GPVAVDPFDPRHAYAFDDGSLVVTLSGGDIWYIRTDPPFVFRVAVDPNNGQRLYASSALDSFGFDPGPELFQSIDGGSTLTHIRIFPANIRTIATTKSDSNVLWVGLEDGTTYRTANALGGAAATWVPLTVTAAPPGQ